MGAIKTELPQNERFDQQKRHEKETLAGEDWVIEFKAKERMIFVKAVAFCFSIIVLAIVTIMLLQAFGLIETAILPVVGLALAVLVVCVPVIMKLLD
ncbi:MAG: hypothetical protein MJA28_06470 [Gammaproteobacteria bacterium]|nr:hypothetical protein [Gammaproteobacteria bacterium]